MLLAKLSMCNGDSRKAGSKLPLPFPLLPARLVLVTSLQALEHQLPICRRQPLAGERYVPPWCSSMAMCTWCSADGVVWLCEFSFECFCFVRLGFAVHVCKNIVNLSESTCLADADYAHTRDTSFRHCQQNHSCAGLAFLLSFET